MSGHDSSMPDPFALLWAEGIACRLEIKNYRVIVSTKARTIRFSCVPERSVRHGLCITKDGKDIYDLSISLILHRGQSEFDLGKDNEPIGYLEYADARKAEGELSAQPAMAEGEVVVSGDAFDTILMLHLKHKEAALLGLRLKGIESGWPLGPMWDVSKTPKLEIMYFSFILSDDASRNDTADESADRAAAIERIEESLTQIEMLIQQGVRIRLFT